MTDLTFIETQFPVSKLSKESYKERKANYSQTLTGLGKWWGRKPLIMVRATLLGLLLPGSDDPRKDRQVFLNLLTMDEDGLFKTASEFRRRELGDSPFGAGLVRHALYAVWQAAESGEVQNSLTWLRTEITDYWTQRESLGAILRYLGALPVAHWRAGAAPAQLVAGAVENDHV